MCPQVSECDQGWGSSSALLDLDFFRCEEREQPWQDLGLGAQRPDSGPGSTRDLLHHGKVTGPLWVSVSSCLGEAENKILMEKHLPSANQAKLYEVPRAQGQQPEPALVSRTGTSMSPGQTAAGAEELRTQSY